MTGCRTGVKFHQLQQREPLMSNNQLSVNICDIKGHLRSEARPLIFGLDNRTRASRTQATIPHDGLGDNTAGARRIKTTFDDLTI